MKSPKLKRRKQVSHIILLFSCYSEFYFVLDENKEKDPLDIIIQELHHLRKQEVKNSANIKFLIRRSVVEDGQARSFLFPLLTQIALKKFEDCLLKPRFQEKLVSYLILRLFNFQCFI